MYELDLDFFNIRRHAGHRGIQLHLAFLDFVMKMLAFFLLYLCAMLKLFWVFIEKN